MSILLRHRIQVVRAQKGKARTLTLLAGLFVRIPVLILNRGVSFPLDPFNRLGYTTRRVTAIVAVCDSIKGPRRHRRPGRQDPRHLLGHRHRSLPSRHRWQRDRELGLNHDHVLFTQIGVRSWKDNDDTIDAMATVARQAGHARLLIVGARRPEGLLERARQRRLEGRVHVWGYRTDVPEILGASECCVDASYAGLGLTRTLREALAVETAAIGTDLEGNPELVRHEETGLLVPPRKPEALAAAMLRMIEQPGFRQATARTGRKLVEVRFSTRAKLDATETLYQTLVKERAQG